jgi:hypothetical protein
MSWTFVIYFILKKQINKEHILTSPKYCIEQNKTKKLLTGNKPYNITKIYRQEIHHALLQVPAVVDCRHQSATPKPYIV